MPPSQLKSLKASLRDHGVLGPQKSKKQKRKVEQSDGAQKDRNRRQAALQDIRDRFNPFDIKPEKERKFQVTGRDGKSQPRSVRPGLAKSAGEDNRRRTLLVDMQRRRKVGGILDRRFGENDPTLTPDERALQRFVREKQRGGRKDEIFNLETADDEGQLTHLGQTLFDKDALRDDFDDAGEALSQTSLDETDEAGRLLKRRKLSRGEDGEGNEIDTPMAPRSRKEIMEEVIAKSKAHKYERQKAKEDDNDVREQLDQGLGDVLRLLNQVAPKAPNVLPKHDTQLFSDTKGTTASSGIHPDRQALLDGKDPAQVAKEYDSRLRQMATDGRSQPTMPSLTAEAKSAIDAEKRKELEDRRNLRMKGVAPEEDEAENSTLVQRTALGTDGGEGVEEENEDTFGLGQGLVGQQKTAGAFEIEEEDQFIIDDDLVNSGSDMVHGDEALSDIDFDTDDENTLQYQPIRPSYEEQSDSDDDVFLKDVADDTLGTMETNDALVQADKSLKTACTTITSCPASQAEFMELLHARPTEKTARVIQEIRAKYSLDLSEDNKAKLATFTSILIDHLHYLGGSQEATSREEPFGESVDATIRHLHSMSKKFPIEVSEKMRLILREITDGRADKLNRSDLIIFAAIGAIYPTSDHFHQVTTPAMLCMTRYLNQKTPKTTKDLMMGLFVCHISLDYQVRSKRYIPEVIHYTLNALASLTSVPREKLSGLFPVRSTALELGLTESFWAGREGTSTTSKRIQFRLINTLSTHPIASTEQTKLALLYGTLSLSQEMRKLWRDKSAFCEIFHPLLLTLRLAKRSIPRHAVASSTKKPGIAPPPLPLDQVRSHIARELEQLQHEMILSASERRPLQLHNHRPLAIKSAYPKFEDDFAPDKHFDPDRERAELAKLTAEHKKERKGAMRELRKDANFVAREQLREKIERDEAYERKYKRLVAEVQGEEGHEAKVYEREKRLRQGKH